MGLNPSEEYFELPERKEIAIEYDIPLFVSVRDSMMYELLGWRRNVAHLHCEIEERSSKDGVEWKKIDPEPFLAYLNDYIQGLQHRMETLQFDRRPQRPLNMTNLFAVMKECGVLYPRIVAAQCVLESGWMTSNLCIRFCNLFGLFDSRKKDYYHFNTWEESVAAYVRLVQSKYDPKRDKDYYDFLKRIGYAENMDDYNAKIRAIANTL